jgi:hypothetical protein
VPSRVGNASHPGRVVHVEPHQAGRRLSRLAGVRAHADTNPLARWPIVRTQRQLHLNHGGHAIIDRGENREEPVPRGVVHKLESTIFEKRRDQLNDRARDMLRSAMGLGCAPAELDRARKST